MAEDILVSDYLKIEYSQFDDRGIFDAVINRDSAFFINILRLKETTTSEFKGSYQRINDFFSGLATLLENADDCVMTDKCFKAAYKQFDFSEVNGINLGFSESPRGAGFGEALRKQVVKDAYTMVKKGVKAPELFHLLPLFEENVGPDRLSDMIATIILPDIQAYTRRIEQELGICPDGYPDEMFEDELWINPYKKCKFLFLPTEILHELPVAKDWEDIERVASENNVIRQELNYEVGEEWTKWAARDKKDYLKRHVFMDPETCERVLTGYRDSNLENYDLSEDEKYFVLKLWQRVKINFAIQTRFEDSQKITSEDAAFEIVEIFKDWVENNRGWSEVLDADKHSREKSVQRLIHLAAKYYLEKNNLDMSCEANEGPGPVDFKISKGNDKTVIELKLSSNQDYMHGYEDQVEKYAKAERTDHMLYVLVDVGNPVRINKLLKQHEQDIVEGKRVPNVIIIDSKEQKSASKR